MALKLTDGRMLRRAFFIEGILPKFPRFLGCCQEARSEYRLELTRRNRRWPLCSPCNLRIDLRGHIAVVFRKAIAPAGGGRIACWFVDTNYNGESFFVRHIYFTGVDQPSEKLKRALRVEVDEAALEALYTTKSRPFNPPKTGKIAVEVINH